MIGEVAREALHPVAAVVVPEHAVADPLVRDLVIERTFLAHHRRYGSLGEEDIGRHRKRILDRNGVLHDRKPFERVGPQQPLEPLQVALRIPHHLVQAFPVAAKQVHGQVDVPESCNA